MPKSASEAAESDCTDARPKLCGEVWEGPPVPYELAEYAGVFRVDAAFAHAEPPPHDDWIPDLLLDASEKTFVRVAMRKVKAAVDAFTAPPPIEASGTGVHSVAVFSRLLGGLSLRCRQQALKQPCRTHRRHLLQETSKKAGNSAPLAEMRRLLGFPSILVRFEISNPGSTPVKIFAQPKVVTADGFEGEPPEGAQQPAVLKWMNSEGITIAAAASSCELPAAAEGIWTVAVGMPPDAMISVALHAEVKG